MKRTMLGQNHLGEEILKVYLENCPICFKPMIHLEFLFNLAVSKMESETDKLIQIQQIEEMMERVRKHEKIEFNSVLMGCIEHYLNTPKEIQATRKLKPYVNLEAEDVFLMNQYPINKIYMVKGVG